MGRSILAIGFSLYLAACQSPDAGVESIHAVGPEVVDHVVLVKHAAALPLDQVTAELGVTTARAMGTRGWLRVEYTGPQHPVGVSRQLSALFGVRAQPNYIYEPHLAATDPNYVEQVAHQVTEIERAWDVTTGDGSVVVAVLGSGIQLDHVELRDNLWHNSDEIPDNGIDDDGNDCIDDIVGCDYIDDPVFGDGDPSGGNHETRVAGVIAAAANNGNGGAGVVWNVALMPVRIALSSEQVARAIDYAVGNGADVINMSFGIYLPQVFGEDSLVGEALERAEAADVVVVASAGNEGTMTPSYPAANPQVLGVGWSTNNDSRNGSSNCGWWVDCAAPGDGVITTDNGDAIVSVSGTSFAAPYVSGVAALIRSLHPNWDAGTVRDAIVYSGDAFSPDCYLGYTRVNAGNAVVGVAPTLAKIRLPEAGAVIDPGPLLIVGAARGDSYELQWRPQDGSWAPLASGGTTLGAALGSIDASGWQPGSYSVRLTVTAVSGDIRDEVSFYVGSKQLPGWPVGAFAEVRSSLAMGDLDGDGLPEVLVADVDHWLHGWHGNGAAVWFAPLWQSRPYPHAPALADLDGDGAVEIIVTAHANDSDSGSLAVWQHDSWASPQWVADTGRIHGAPAVADIDGDVEPEIVLVIRGEGNSEVRVLEGDNSAVAGWPKYVGGDARSSPVIADFDGDGRFEIAIGSTSEETIFAGDGTTLDGWPRSIDGAHGELAAADFDHDGRAELVSIERAMVSVVASDGTVVQGWPQEIPSSEYNRLSLGDVTGDGVPEIFVTLKNGEVRAWHANGDVVDGWPVAITGEIWAAAAIADLDGDGHPDVVTPGSDGQLHAWGAGGVAVAGFPKRLHAASTSSPVVGDIDGDGTLDVAVGGTSTHWLVYAWSTGSDDDPFTVEWPSWRGNSRNTGYYPRRFALGSSAEPGGVRLTWTAPSDVDAPTRYAIYRDRQRIAVSTQSTYLDTNPSSTDAAYGVVALDDASMVSARSRLLTVAPLGADPDGTKETQGDVKLMGGCRCNSSAGRLGFFGGLGFVLMILRRCRTRVISSVNR